MDSIAFSVQFDDGGRQLTAEQQQSASDEATATANNRSCNELLPSSLELNDLVAATVAAVTVLLVALSECRRAWLVVGQLVASTTQRQQAAKQSKSQGAKQHSRQTECNQTARVS